jgi:hypothetical protein
MTQFTIIAHAVLIGLTPLIPIPVLDDLVKNYFVRSLIKSLASSYGATLTEKEIAVLTEERSTGCLNGCFFWLFEFVVKRLIRKVLFVLEWRRAIDLVTHTFYYGYLLNYAFEQGWYVAGDPNNAAKLRAAVERARAGANTNLVKRVVQSTFNQSRQLVLGTVQQISDSIRDIAFRRSRVWARRTLAARLRQRIPWLGRILYRLFKPNDWELEQVRRAESEVDERLTRESPRFQAGLGGVIAQLQAGITELPSDHFEEMQTRLGQALKSA